MFGTLSPASIDYDRGGSLEFIQNLDPASAISRRVQGKSRIACDLCRSKKARCSGGWKTCQRCEAMVLECVYSESQGHEERQKRSQNPRTAIRRNMNSTSTRTIHDESNAHDSSRKLDDRETSTTENSLQGNMFGDGGIDESPSSPWSIHSPMQNNFGSGSSSGGNPYPSESFISPSTCNSTTMSSTAQVFDSLMLDASRTTLPLPMEYMDTWEELQIVHGDLSGATNGGENVTVSSTLKLSYAKSVTGPDSCDCLLSSISFLQKLTSRSTSHESRIDRLLADVRNSMETLARFMACELCAVRVEQNILFAMAARHLSVICNKTANCYKALQLRGLDETSSSRQSSDDDISGLINISVLTYRASQREGQHLIKSLVSFQMAELQQHIDTMKSRYHIQPNQGQAEAIFEAENSMKLAQAVIDSHC